MDSLVAEIDRDCCYFPINVIMESLGSGNANRVGHEHFINLYSMKRAISARILKPKSAMTDQLLLNEANRKLRSLHVIEALGIYKECNIGSI